MWGVHDIPHELGSASVAPTRLTENTPDGHSEMSSTCWLFKSEQKVFRVICARYLKPEVLAHRLCGDVLEFNFKRSSDGGRYSQPLASNYFSLYRSDLKSALQTQRWGVSNWMEKNNTGDK